LRRRLAHRLRRPTADLPAPFDAELGTPEGEKIAPIHDETALLNAITQIMQRPRTAEVINYLLRLPEWKLRDGVVAFSRGAGRTEAAGPAPNQRFDL
jgi:hypothetical protein